MSGQAPSLPAKVGITACEIAAEIEYRAIHEFGLHKEPIRAAMLRDVAEALMAQVKELGEN
ncbi:MAG: hypothetical protein KGL39_30390 [Patescibacteria group bacterium]|nr:hypothetical protein [Patescibacteria group bacterium]